MAALGAVEAAALLGVVAIKSQKEGGQVVDGVALVGIAEVVVSEEEERIVVVSVARSKQQEDQEQEQEVAMDVVKTRKLTRAEVVLLWLPLFHAIQIVDVSCLFSLSLKKIRCRLLIGSACDMRAHEAYTDGLLWRNECNFL